MRVAKGTRRQNHITRSFVWMIASEKDSVEMPVPRGEDQKTDSGYEICWTLVLVQNCYQQNNTQCWPWVGCAKNEQQRIWHGDYFQSSENNGEPCVTKAVFNVAFNKVTCPTTTFNSMMITPDNNPGWWSRMIIPGDNPRVLSTVIMCVLYLQNADLQIKFAKRTPPPHKKSYSWA